MTSLLFTRWRERAYHIHMTILCGVQGAAEDLSGVLGNNLSIDLGTGELYRNLAEIRHPNLWSRECLAWLEAPDDLHKRNTKAIKSCTTPKIADEPWTTSVKNSSWQLAWPRSYPSTAVHAVATSERVLNEDRVWMTISSSFVALYWIIISFWF